MGVNLTVLYAVLTILLTIADFVVAWQAFQKPEEIGKHLGLAALCAGIVTLSFLTSLWAKSYRGMSLASSIYFIFIDWMLVAVARFVYRYTRIYLNRKVKIIRISMMSFAAFDTAVMLINVFWEIAVSYQRTPTPGTVLMMNTYLMKPLYVIHLVFDYVLVALVLITLLVKCIRTPGQYRNQYLLIMAAIILVVVINAVFLFMDGNALIDQLDFSTFIYSGGLMLCYWAAFNYRQNNMLESLSMTIFQNIGQGIVLFDYMDEMVMHNRKAEVLLPGVKFEEGMPGRAFQRACGIRRTDEREDFCSIQSEAGTGGRPLRCDYSRLRDQRGQVIGHLYVFTDETADVDLMTGFQRVDTFRRFVAENSYYLTPPVTAVVIDLLGLGEINRVFGRGTGDQRIRHLAQLLREQMPEGTIFVRGFEAHLVAVCRGVREKDVLEKLREIERMSSGNLLYGIRDNGDDSGMSVIDIIEAASSSLKVKKLLHSKSIRSQTISSLVRALKESDSDTEAHVQRTQIMGQALGRRIGLRDSELTDLRLLCLLHDIGKIGIPLEILNKPGRLSEQEMTVLHTHPEKGYQIAMSSDELKHIAPMILYHHERWDGKGYPEGLAEKNIPILSRIISIVDSYDAMVNDRSYRKALAPEEAQEELRRNAGTQFDPELAREFLAMLAEMPKAALEKHAEQELAREILPEAEPGNEKRDTFNIPYSRYMLDLDDVIIEVDDRFEEITGYSREDAVGRMSQYALISPESRGYYLVQVNQSFANGNIAYLKHDILRKDGSKVQVVCYGKRYYDSAEKEFRSEILIYRV